MNPSRNIPLLLAGMATLCWSACGASRAPQAVPAEAAPEAEPTPMPAPAPATTADVGESAEEVVPMPLVVCFGSGESTIHPSERAGLEELAELLRGRTDIVGVRALGTADVSREGYAAIDLRRHRGIEHCQAFDSGFPQRYRDESNMSDNLSRERAEAVVDYLVEEQRLPRELFALGIDRTFHCRMRCAVSPGVVFEAVIRRPPEQ